MLYPLSYGRLLAWISIAGLGRCAEPV
ncbi:MAG: hypothetical protein JWQ95_7010, partial [Sphaerisporangium sp.]|nr:hypothetical protein [Sphaerisporangium sp.]